MLLFHKWITCILLNVRAIYIAAVKKLWIRFFTSENGAAFPKLVAVYTITKCYSNSILRFPILYSDSETENDREGDENLKTDNSESDTKNDVEKILNDVCPGASTSEIKDALQECNEDVNAAAQQLLGMTDESIYCIN